MGYREALPGHCSAAGHLHDDTLRDDGHSVIAQLRVAHRKSPHLGAIATARGYHGVVSPDSWLEPLQ
jgi:hypothetical protein